MRLIGVDAETYDTLVDTAQRHHITVTEAAKRLFALKSTLDEELIRSLARQQQASPMPLQFQQSMAIAGCSGCCRHGAAGTVASILGGIF